MDGDFELQPLDGCGDDDDDVDAKNLDTFADGGTPGEAASGDDWKPDENAVGAFEALRVATQQQMLQHEGQRQHQRLLPTFSSLQREQQQDENCCDSSVYGTALYVQQQRHQQEPFAGQEQQLLLLLQRQGRLRQQPFQQQQQPVQHQLQQQQQQSLHQGEQLHRRTSAAGAEDVAAGGQRFRGPVNSDQQRSSRSTVTEQLNRLIALTRQQHQQRAAAPDISATKMTAPAAASATDAFTAAAGPAASLVATGPAAAGPAATEAGFVAVPSAAGAFFERFVDTGSAAERPATSDRAFAVDLFLTRCSEATSITGNAVAANTGPALAREMLKDSPQCPGRPPRGDAAGARHEVPATVPFVAPRPPPGLQLQHFASSYASSKQQQHLLNNFARDSERQQLLAERERVIVDGGTPSADAAASSASDRLGTLPAAAEEGVFSLSDSRTVAALRAAIPYSTEDAAGDALTEEEERNVLLLLKDLNITAAALAALDGAAVANAADLPPRTAAANAARLQQLQRQLRNGLEPPPQGQRAQPQEELHQHQLLQQKLRQQQRQQQQKLQRQQYLELLQQQQQKPQRQQQQEVLEQEQQKLLQPQQQQSQTVHWQERHKRLRQQQQRLLHFLRPNVPSTGSGVVAAEEEATGRGNGAALTAPRPATGGGTATPPAHISVGGRLQQPDNQTSATPAAARLLWEAILPRGQQQLQQLPRQQEQQQPRQPQEPTPEEPPQQSVTPLVLLQRPRETPGCAPAAVGAQALQSLERARCTQEQQRRQQEQQQQMQQHQQMQQQQPVQEQQQMQPQLFHHVQQRSSGSTSDTNINEGVRTEKKVFTEAEVLQMLTAANRRSSSSASSASSSMQLTHTSAPSARHQRQSFQILQHPQQVPPRPQQQQAQEQQMKGQHALLQQQRQVQYQEKEQQVLQQHMPEEPQEMQNSKMQRQQQQVAGAWLPVEEVHSQQLRDGIHQSSMTGGVHEERGRRQQQPQHPPPPAAPRQQHPRFPQQQQRLQWQQEAQHSGRCCHALGSDSDESRESVGTGAAEAAAGAREQSGCSGRKTLSPSSLEKSAAALRATAPATADAANALPGKAAPGVWLRGPISCPRARLRTALTGVHVRPPPSRSAAAGVRAGTKAAPSDLAEGGEASPGTGPFSSAVTGGVGKTLTAAAAARGESSSAAASLASILASHLFPLTKAHREMAVKQQLEELAPWRLPQHLERNGTSIPTPSSISKSSSNGNKRSRYSSEAEKIVEKSLRGGKEQLMTAFDLEYILRLQLMNMAKQPQLQLVSGRWNFRFFRSQSIGAVGAGSNRGEGDIAAVDQALQRKPSQPVLPSVPVEMEQHLLRLLLHQETLRQQLTEHVSSTAAPLQKSRADGSEGLATGEVNLLLLPPVLERKLHGGVGITVVDSCTRMHRLLLGSITLREATTLLDPLLQIRQSFPYATKREATATGGLQGTSSSSKGWAATATLPDAGSLEEVDIGMLEPLNEDTIEERPVRKAAKNQQQLQQRQRSIAEERELRRLQKRFGKQTYCSVRQPRSSIHVRGTATASATVEGEPRGCDISFAQASDGTPGGRRGSAAPTAGRGEREADAAAETGRQEQQQGLSGSGVRPSTAGDAAESNLEEKARRKLLRAVSGSKRAATLAAGSPTC